MAGSLPSRERGLKYAHLPQGRRVFQSLPSRERGLKYVAHDSSSGPGTVAPFKGAWIEISRKASTAPRASRRSPQGSVD